MRYSSVRDKLYCSCVEFEYTGEDDNIVVETRRIGPYKVLNVARAQRAVFMNDISDHYKNFTVLRRWDEEATTIWNEI